MLGVVLWSNRSEGKAVVWCEDHGQLAYYGETVHAAATPELFDEGDLIQFDLREHHNMRLVQNPRRIAQHFCSDLSNVVQAAGALKREIEGARASSVACDTHKTAEPISLASARERMRPTSGRLNSAPHVEAS